MKRLFSILVTFAMLCSLSVNLSAADQTTQNTADALYSLSLFLGYGDGSKTPNYGLDDPLTREQGVLLLLRLLGQYDEAEKSSEVNPFADVTNYSAKYIAYAYRHGLTKGTSATTFEGSLAMNAPMFLTFCLRSLGYQDGENGDFAYSQVEQFAAAKGLGTSGSFTRGSAVALFWDTLSLSLKDGTKTLSDRLIANGVFSSEDYSEAKRIRQNGSLRTELGGSSSGSSTSGGSSSGGSSSGGSSSGGGQLPSKDFLPEQGEIVYEDVFV